MGGGTGHYDRNHHRRPEQTFVETTQFTVPEKSELEIKMWESSAQTKFKANARRSDANRTNGRKYYLDFCSLYLNIIMVMLVQEMQSTSDFEKFSEKG